MFWLKAISSFLLLGLIYGLMGFLTLPYKGEFIGLGLYLLFFILCFRYFKHIAIFLANGVEPKSIGLSKAANNEALLLGLKECLIIGSSKISNIRIVSNLSSKKLCILIDDEILRGLSTSAIRQIIRSHRKEREEGLFNYRVFMCIIHILIYLPFMPLNLLPSTFSSLIFKIIDFFFSPISLFFFKQAKIIRSRMKREDMIELDHLINKDDWSIKQLVVLNFM